MIFWCPFVGLILGLLGSAILAWSLGPLLSMLATAVNAHELSISSIASKGDAVVFTGFDKQLERATKRAGFWTVLGFATLVVSFALQAIGLWLSIL